MATILVTGGAGFIGSNIVAALAERGESVVVCDWLGLDGKWRNLARHEIADLIMPHHVFDWLAAEGEALDAVVHMGANSSTTETDADNMVENNLRLSLDLWHWCARAEVPLIYASSAATYGDGSAGFDDDGAPEALARLRPLNVYGWTKHLFDRRIARLIAEDGPRPPQWAGLKFFNVYGPNEFHKASMRSVALQAFEQIRAGGPVRLFKSDRNDYADGGQLRDFLYVRDAVDVVLWLLDNPAISGLYNCGSGQARAFADLARAVFRALNREEAIEYIAMPRALRDRYQYFTEARMDRLRQAGYARPMSGLEDGVRDYVHSFLSRDDPYR